MLLFKTYIQEFVLDRHLEHMFNYQGIQSVLPVFLVGEFGTFKIFMQKWLFGKAWFFIFLQPQSSRIDDIWTEYDHIFLFTDHKSTPRRFCFIYNASNVGIVEKKVEKDPPPNYPWFSIFSKIK